MDARTQAIVIGGSAGGIQALDVLLPALPADFALPVLVVVHIPAGRPSQLAELFAQRCAVQVVEAADKEPIAPATVYFAPPDYHLLVEPGGTLALSIDAPVNYSRPSIDVLFESAAHVWRERLLAVVLSGANSDGSAGAATVRRLGGRVWAQDPAEAMVSVMPASVVDTGAVDRVLTLDDMVDSLRRLQS